MGTTEDVSHSRRWTKRRTAISTHVPRTVRQTTKMRTQTRVPRTVLSHLTTMRTQTRVPRTVLAHLTTMRTKIRRTAYRTPNN